MSSDAIVILRGDHNEVKKLFREFTSASPDQTRKQQVVDAIIELLTIHTFIENEVLYPRVRALLPDLQADILQSYEEHHVADVLIMELQALTADDDRFDAKTTVLIELVKHHMQEEEDDWFPKVRQGLGRSVLQEIGQELLAAKTNAPPANPAVDRQAGRQSNHRVALVAVNPVRNARQGFQEPTEWVAREASHK